jgi:ribosomal protein L16/L10AE
LKAEKIHQAIEAAPCKLYCKQRILKKWSAMGKRFHKYSKISSKPDEIRMGKGKYKIIKTRPFGPHI